ncbi:MAG TPA: AAA family ATPase [Candidatus Limnocylindria bacterium]|nr:AAA family ATPase [Candidatus Limnocylindria bacterium]
MPPRSRASTPAKRKPSGAARAFLFSDLREYTSYVEAKGDAAAARLLREYRTLVRREVARHDGAEVKTEGDSFYVVFNSASSAIDCAVSVLRAAAAQNERDPSAPLRIGIGLHAGETVEYDDQFVGSAVNIASRLAGKAQAMELIISDTLRGLVRTSQTLAMTDRGPLELKGVAEPIRAWSVEWREPKPAVAPPIAERPAMASAPTAAPATGQLLCPVVVGRAAETATFDTALAAALAGAGQTVILAGEAGVGKSKFVRGAQAHATERGARVLVGLTHQSDSALPYAPFVSAIRSGFHGLDRDELGRVLQRSAPDLAELFPELGRIERAAAPTGLERHRLTVAFQHLFRAFAREAPVLVVLEDLHWADETSLELLQHLARELRDARVLILATYRSDEMHRRHPLLRTLAGLQRERLVTEILLKRLTPDETRELIRATFAERDPNVKVSEEFRDAVYARSEGNPFFTEELLKAIVDSGGVYWQDSERGWARKPIDELAIPGSIREAVRARVEELSPEARDTLSAASVIGHRFSFEVLREVTGADERALETRIREFIELQLVTDASGGDEEHAFRHALTREVVYDDLLVRERKRLHRAVADALERDRRAEPSLLAHHLLAAGEQERAVPKLLEAASRAERADAPRDAAAHYERAIEIGVPDERLPAVLEQLAESYQHFDEARSQKAAMEAAAAFRQRGDRRGRSRALRLASRQHWLRAEGDSANTLAREAIDVLEGEESVELARALAHLAGLQMTAGRRTEAIETADRAIALAERFDDPFALSNALISKGSSQISWSNNADVAVATIDRGRSVALAAGLVTTAARAWNNQSLYLGFVGWSLDRQLAFVREGIAYARSHGQERSMVAWLQRGEAELLAQTGDLRGAIDAWEAVRGGSAYLGRAGMTMCVLAIDGPQAVRAPALEELARLERGDPQQYVPTAGLAALVLGVDGDIAVARQTAEALLERCADRGTAELVSGAWHVLMTCVALTTGVTGLLDAVRARDHAPTPRALELRTTAVAAADALRANELAAAGVAVARHWEIANELGFPFTSAQLIFYTARATGMPTIAAVPEWRRPLDLLREFATRAGARWWLEQLPT